MEPVQSWGRLQAPVQHTVTPEGWRQFTKGSVLAFGNGRSYGDSCLNGSGHLIDMRHATGIISFDADAFTARIAPGTLLGDIVTFAAGHGCFLPVVPGTRFVSIAGAVANDIHGKNHHRRGTFGAHVVGLGLDRSADGQLHCSPLENAELFSATIGGLGLTGLITYVDLKLMPVTSLDVRQIRHRFDRLADYFALSDAHDAHHEYSVAWIDQLSSGRNFGRGILILGDHADTGNFNVGGSKPRLSVPFTPPISALNRFSLKAFNALYYGRTPSGRSENVVSWESYFHPLDQVRKWNRLYGPNGLVQHQSVVPEAGGQDAVAELLDGAARHGQSSFLTVLKRFGSAQSPGLVSFPRAGYTLTLDFPHNGARTLQLLSDLDRITVAAGGAVNPYKDARMSPEVFAASFPNWRSLEKLRDPAFMSDFWRRTAMRIA